MLQVARPIWPSQVGVSADTNYLARNKGLITKFLESLYRTDPNLRHGRRSGLSNRLHGDHSELPLCRQSTWGGAGDLSTFCSPSETRALRNVIGDDDSNGWNRPVVCFGWLGQSSFTALPETQEEVVEIFEEDLLGLSDRSLMALRRVDLVYSQMLSRTSLFGTQRTHRYWKTTP